MRRRVPIRYVVLGLALLALAGGGAFALFSGSASGKFEDCMLAGDAQRVTSPDQLARAVHDWAAGRAGMSGWSEFGSNDGLATFSENVYRPRQYRYEVAAIYDNFAQSPNSWREGRNFWRRALRDPSSLKAVYLASRPEVADPFGLVSDCDEEVNGPLNP